MDSAIKFLKIIVLLTAILIGFSILAGLFLFYKGVTSEGDLNAFVKKQAVENILDDTDLTPAQKEMVESGDYEGLVSDLQENVTPEQINCAIEAVGEERAQELMNTQDPTPQELLLLSKCL